MITPILEKLILNGDANFTVWNHGLGMFGRIPSQNGKVTVITKMIWYPFLDYRNNGFFNNTWGNLFQLSEYQLKIESQKSLNYYQFRNSIKWYLTDPVNHPIDLSAAFTANDYKYIAIQPGEPVIIDTFLVCSGPIKLTISNNASQAFVATTQPPAKAATEQDAPNGVGNMQVLEKVVRSAPPFAPGVTDQYNPPSNEFSGLAPATNGRNKENYVSEIIGPNGIWLNSILNSPGAYLTNIYSSLPLVTFHCVNINRDAADRLQNTK